MELITKHLSRKNLKCKVYEKETICAFSGKEIKEGVLLVDLISDVFTDFEYVKYPSNYVSIEYAMLIADVVKGKTRNNSLRNYSYLATDNELRFLKREDFMELLFNIPETPFRIALSYNFKKHTTYKTVLNTLKEDYTITTDLYNVRFSKAHVEKFLPVIQEWYTAIPEKSKTVAQPTWFTKQEIMTGVVGYHKTQPYGLEKFEEQNNFLLPFRNTHIFELIVHILNKRIC